MSTECIVKMKIRYVIQSLMGMGLFTIASIGAVFAQSPLVVPPIWGPGHIQPPSVSLQPPALNDRSQDIIRQTPTLSGRLQLSQQTLLPYIGAGFGGGFVTERDRAMGPSSVIPQQNLLGESLGKGVMPNEFQMGIRIPF
jgi:hypothetical protein